MKAHPLPQVRHALQAPPWIEPVPDDDPKSNPADDPSQVFLHLKKFSARKEVEVIADSLARWLPEHSDNTVAVLVSSNPRAQELIEELERRKIDFVDSLLKSTSATRATAGVLRDILDSLADPNSSMKLAAAYRAWRTQTSAEEADPAGNPPDSYLAAKNGACGRFCLPIGGA